ncbi:MAG: hypothetical protein ACREE6_07565 [Limisphaerales bacterium]
MTWHVLVRPEVEQDVADAANWYDGHQAGLGREFREEIIQVFDALKVNPLLYCPRHSTKTSVGVIRNDFLTASFTRSRKAKRPW